MPSEPRHDREKDKATEAQASPAPLDTQDKQTYTKEPKPAGPAGSSAVRRQPRPKKEKKAPAPGEPYAGGLFGAIGQVLYLLGFYAECKAVQLWRVLRVAFGLLGQLCVWAFGGVARAIWRFLKGFFRDLFAPFHRFFVGVGNVRKVLSEEKQKGSEHAQKTALKYFGSGVRTYLYLVGNLIKFLMPVAAAFIFGFTVYSVLNLEYNLEITVNGVPVGVIAEEATFEEARSIVRQRIVAAEDKGAESWQVVPEYSLTGIGRLTTKEQLVNNMLQTYDPGDDDALVEATGIYVGGDLFVTDDGEAVVEFMEGLKARYATGDVEVDFVQEVSYDLEAEDLFFASSVHPAGDIIESLTDIVQERETYMAGGEETLSDIAHNNGIALTTLLDYNPDLRFESWDDGGEEGEEEAAPPDEDGEDDEEDGEGSDALSGEYIPAPGTELVVQPERRYLQVQTSRVVWEEEAIPYETYYEDNEDWVKGRSDVMVYGEEGVQSVPYEITTIDGIETKLPAEGVEPRVLREPVHEVIEQGVFEFDYTTLTPNIEGSGAYIWPVPNYTRQGRGMVNGHYGADINAPAWEAILAIAEGTVTQAGWHYSYGNYVVIDHGDGVTSLYAHANELLVEAGDKVSQGTTIALIGTTGNSTGYHLHIEITINGVRVEPYNYISPPA